jgi:iron complex outermembrane recepter protein
MPACRLIEGMMTNRIAFSITAAVVAALGGVAAPTAAAADAGDSAPGPATIEEIVVTARRVKESMQDVPIAITALSGDSLQQEHITSNQDLMGKVPSLIVGSNGQVRSSETFTLRGQGAAFLSSQGVVEYMAEAPVISGLFTSTQGGPGAFLDLDNLQVLKGPQGTLFGRNTTGGAVVLEPTRPTDEFGGYVQGQTGNYSDREFEGVLNVPVISDKLAVRISARSVDRDGFTTNLASDEKLDSEKYWTGRVGILFTPTDAVSNYLMLFNTDELDSGTGLVGLAINSGRPNDKTGIAYNEIYAIYNLLHGTHTLNGCAGFDALNETTGCGQSMVTAQNALGARTVDDPANSFNKLRTWGANDVYSWKLLDNLTFRDIASYSRLEVLDDGDPSGFPSGFSTQVNAPNFYTTNVEQWTEEAQLQGKARDGNFKYTIGGYTDRYSPGGPMGTTTLTDGGLVTDENTYGVTRRSVAGYAQGVYNLGDLTPALSGLNLTGGYRYSWDTNSGFASGLLNIPELAALKAAPTSCLVGSTLVYPNCEVTATQHSSAPNWLLGADYKFTPKVLGYFHVTQGYKAGGFNALSVNPETRTFDPEYNRTYEVGLKSDFKIASMPTRIDAGVYRSNYTNIQRAATDANTTGGVGAALFNAGAATIEGFELETTMRPLERLELAVSYSYTDAYYKTFELLVPAASAATVDCTGALITAGEHADLHCVPFAYVAKDQGSVSAHYTLPLRDSIGAVIVGGRYSYITRQYTSPTTLPSQEPFAYLSPYGVANFSIDWKSIMNGPVDGQFFINNAFNKLYRISNSDVFAVQSFTAAIYGNPMMFGVQVRYRFGGLAKD